ncbi:MAG: hypothetical protein GY943_34980, partial [Chloroflexi bacterium]|nr:hypothetical protein [Chloroflexota bacterium]
MIIDANQHSGAFSRVVTIPSVTAGTYTVKAISENLTEDTAAFNVPCDIPPTPTPPTATPTSTPRPADLVMISPPQLLSAPPINAYESVDFRVVITNTGDIDINQQFFVDLYFDPTAIFSTYIPITESVGLAAVSGLPSGESRVITITAPTGFKNIPDPHMVYSMVDSVNVPGGQIAEANETNNVSNPATIYNVIPAGTPTATPTPDPSGTDSISGIVQSRVTQWIPQNRAIVYLVDSLSQIITVQQTDENGFYSFNNVQPDQYTVYSCIDIEGI